MITALTILREIKRKGEGTLQLILLPKTSFPTAFPPQTANIFKKSIYLNYHGSHMYNSCQEKKKKQEKNTH